MKILIANQSEVPQLLPMNECMDVMAEALKTLNRGDAVNPLRSALWLPDRTGALAVLPGYLGDIQAMGLKIGSVFPGNRGTEYDHIQGIVVIFETEHGCPLAIADANSITAIRTAAVSGVATRLLARQDAEDLAILGSGTQARTHLEAMLVAREIKRVRVWSRTPEHAQAFAQRESERHGIPVEPVPTAQEAVEGTDVICTATGSPEPVLMGDWLAPGMHINAVGSSVPSKRELDVAAVVKSRLFVDRRESTLNEGGEFLFAKKEGAAARR